MNHNKPKLSIIIVTYNSSKIIGQCLESIKKHNDIGNALEVIIVDNCSSDFEELKSTVAKSEVPVRLYQNNRNGGYGQGNNIGINNSNAPFIMIMNPDVVLYMPVFSSVLTKMDNEYIDLLGIEQYEADRKKRHSYFPLRMNFGNMLIYKLAKSLHYFTPKLFCVHGACFFIRRDAMVKIGCFDENIFLYGEEIDLHTRLQRNGAKISFEPSLGYIHPLNERSFSKKSNNTGLDSQLYLCEKFGWRKEMAIKDAISILKFEQTKRRLRGLKADANITSQISDLRKML